MSDRVSQLPNVLSTLRIPLGLVLLLIAAMSPGFMVIYLLCCLTDVLDGALARRLDARSELGARLDSAADLILVSVLLWKLWPIITPTAREVLWIAVVAIIRASAAVIARLRFGVFGFLHTWGNKLTGILLVLYPFSLLLTGARWPMYLLLLFAGASAMEELLIELFAADWNADRKSLLSVSLRKE